MSPLDDYNLSDEDGADDLPLDVSSGESAGAEHRSAWLRWWPIAAAVAVAGLIGLSWFFFRSDPIPVPPLSPVESPTVAEKAPVATTDGADDLVLPPLTASDEIVRQLVAELSQHPRLLSWLANEDLVQRFVAAVDNVAEGDLPRSHVGFMAPDEPFSARQQGGRYFVDPESYGRWDAAAGVIASLDASGVAALYRRLGPLIEAADHELGYPNRNFDATFAGAIDIILQTPRIEEMILVTPGVRSYSFYNEELEALLPIQKLMLRMGPDNLARVQSKLRQLVRELGFSAAQ